LTLKYGLEVTQGYSNWYHSKACGFLFAFRSNYGSILHHYRDKARYWSKIVIFFTARRVCIARTMPLQDVRCPSVPPSVRPSACHTPVLCLNDYTNPQSFFTIG